MKTLMIYWISLCCLVACGQKPPAELKHVTLQLQLSDGDPLHCQHCVASAAEGLMGAFPQLAQVQGDPENNTLTLALPVDAIVPNQEALQKILFPLNDGSIILQQP